MSWPALNGEQRKRTGLPDMVECDACGKRDLVSLDEILRTGLWPECCRSVMVYLDEETTEKRLRASRAERSAKHREEDDAA